jgi:hypothetical protein
VTGRLHPERPERLRAQGRESSPAPRVDPEIAQLLRLQQAAGNRAVGRVLARRAVRQTGMRREPAIERFVHKAVSFLGHNRDAELKIFAIYLGAAVNEELAAVGCPAVKVELNQSVVGAEFDAASWTMTINPAEFSHRPGVRTLGDLEREEAAVIASTVYHEARHAEQRFRVARLDAAEGHKPAFTMPGGTAEAAAASPLATGGREAQEAREWREDQTGADALYRAVINRWLPEVGPALKLAQSVDARNVAEVYEQIAQQLHDWNQPGLAANMVRGHLSSARRRRRTAIAGAIQQILHAYDAAVAAHAALRDDANPEDFSPLIFALWQLNQAVTDAYAHQGIEDDAWAADDAVRTAYGRATAPTR